MLRSIDDPWEDEIELLSFDDFSPIVPAELNGKKILIQAQLYKLLDRHDLDFFGILLNRDGCLSVRHDGFEKKIWYKNRRLHRGKGLPSFVCFLNDVFIRAYWAPENGAWGLLEGYLDNDQYYYCLSNNSATHGQMLAPDSSKAAELLRLVYA